MSSTPKVGGLYIRAAAGADGQENEPSNQRKGHSKNKEQHARAVARAAAARQAAEQAAEEAAAEQAAAGLLGLERADGDACEPVPNNIRYATNISCRFCSRRFVYAGAIAKHELKCELAQERKKVKGRRKERRGGVRPRQGPQVETEEEEHEENEEAMQAARAEALRLAAEEGLTLKRSEKSNTGFVGVHVRPGGKTFSAQMWLDGKVEYLGTFATAERTSCSHLPTCQARGAGPVALDSVGRSPGGGGPRGRG
jgi:hypothetical protein